MPCLNPYSHDPHIPANHCTAKLPLHSHYLACIENLLLTLYYCGGDIMLNKKLVDIYYYLMMLTYIRRRMEGWTTPIRCFVPFESPRPEFRVLCFLTSVPNRVWGAMGPPFLTYLSSYILVVARADLHLHVCVLVGSPVVS